MKPTFIVLGSEASFHFKQAIKTKSLETSTRKLMYNFYKKSHLPWRLRLDVVIFTAW